MLGKCLQYSNIVIVILVIFILIGSITVIILNKNGVVEVVVNDLSYK